MAKTAPVKIEEVAPDALKNIKVPPVVPKSLKADTTHQEDITKAGQRRINLLWEYTQAIIACVVVFTAMFASVWVVVIDRVIKVIPADASLASAWTIIATAIGLVVGFYFSRTNHSAIGGVGPKEQPTDKGTR